MRSWIAAALTACMLVASASATAGDGASGGPVVRDAWARATPPGASVAAAYLTIVGGAGTDRLVSARSAVAGMTQVHSVTESDGITRMREVDDVEIPAGTSVVFAPQGLHLMLMNLQQPLVAGQRFKLTLKFARAGERDVDVAIVAPGQAPPAAH